MNHFRSTKAMQNIANYISDYKFSRTLFFCLLSSVFCLLSSVYAEVPQLTISDVKVVGNRTLTDVRVLEKVRSRPGQVFSAGIAEEDSKRVAELSGVDYSYYSTKVIADQIELTFVVVERNIVRAIIFVGNKKYKSGQLVNKLSFKLGDFLDPLQARGGVEALSDFYKSKGYPHTKIELDADKLSEGRVIYRIEEASRVKITDIKFVGNEALKDSQLKKVVKTKKKKFLVFTKYYVEDEVTKDVINLLNTYYERGFLDSKIEPELNFNEDKSGLALTFNISEGRAYSVDDITIAGNTQFDEAELREKLRLEIDKVYNKRKADYDVKGLTTAYRQTGYVEAEVEKEKKFVAEDRVKVEYKIEPGSRFKIGQINITGNKETKDRVIRRVLDEYDFKPGQWYNADITKGNGEGMLEKYLQRMVVAESAIIKPSGNDPNIRDAQVNITEGQTGMIMLGAGVGSDSGVIGQLIFEQRNFDFRDKPKSLWEFFTGKAYKGAGQTFRIAIEPGTELSRYSMSFTEPYFRDKPTSMNLLASNYERGRESYDEERLKGLIGFEKRYKSGWRRSIAVRAENVDIVGTEPDTPLDVLRDKGGNSIFGLRLGFGKDKRDDRFNPSTGYSFNVGYEQVAGDHTFGIVDVVYRYYKTLNEDLVGNKTILALKLLGASTVGNAPVFEKFYAGGSGTYGIRGFEYRGISPRGKYVGTIPNPVPPPATIPAILQGDDPVGSDWIGIANAEVTIPLGNETFALLLFVDSGIVETGGVRAAAGTGIQIMIPQWFGPVPMRFEIAAPLMSNGDDDTQAFSFSVGRLF